MDLPASGMIVRTLPTDSDAKHRREFVSELASSISSVVRPCVVLDCSRVRRMDRELLHLLLCCLEEAIKRNGDVRLAGFPEAAQPALEALGMDRLFRLFPTTMEAAESFRRPAALATVIPISQKGTERSSIRAA